MRSGVKHNMIHYVTGLLLLVSPLIAASQTTTSRDTSVVIIQDDRVDMLVEKHIKINQTLKTIEGFRIQVFSESGINSKTSAYAMKDELISRYPDMGVYLTFKSPNYKVRVGDFRTRLDAQRFMNELAADYPNSFIIADQINLPKTDH